MRRILTIAAILILLIGIGVFVFIYFFAQKPTINVAPGGGIALPIAGPGTGANGEGAEIPLPGAPMPVTTRLVRVSKGPVVQGAVVVATPVASSSPEITVRYIERQSGNVFMFSPKTGTITRTNNQTVPGIQSATWMPDGTMAFVRYLSGDMFTTVNTYGLPAKADESQDGFFLSQNISDISVSSTSVLTLSSGVNGSIALLGNTKDSRTTELFVSPLSSLRLSFAGNSQYLAATKPTAVLPGFAFLFDKSTFSRIAGPHNGLTALASPSGKWVLVSYVENDAMKMDLVDTSTNEATSLPVVTIADKCVWSASGETVYCGIPVDPPIGYVYPDDWYQGAVSFSDRIWKIEAGGRYAQLVLDFSKETDESLDAISLAIDPLNTTLVFTNKNDESLWSYQL